MKAAPVAATPGQPAAALHWRLAQLLSQLALAGMILIPLIEIVMRPWQGQGIQNAPVLVQHLGLMLAMAGGLLALQQGHLATVSQAWRQTLRPGWTPWLQALALGVPGLLCGALAWSGWQLVASERQAPHDLAYGVPVWWLQASMPIGFVALGALITRPMRLLQRRQAAALLVPAAGAALTWLAEGHNLPLWPLLGLLLAATLAGAPVFTVLGGLALALFAHDGSPLASVALSHYQITVNASLPALPLFTLAGLVLAATGAAERLGQVFLAAFGQGNWGTVLATAVLCSLVTAFTGGSGVTILALGGLLLPLLLRAGVPAQRSISLITSASALGVLLAPSLPLIMLAIIARVPINTLFLAGLVPAAVMVVCLLVLGGFLRRPPAADGPGMEALPPRPALLPALWRAKWELMSPLVAIGSLVSGTTTPVESAALTVLYVLLTQAWAHHELGWARLRQAAERTGAVIGGVMLILGMALALTNYLIEAGVPDAAIDAVRGLLPQRWAFWIALNLFLLLAGALMEIFAAIVVLVPLLLPVAQSYGIDPLHFCIVFLANMEMGFLCPPAGMNLYFASAMFDQPLRQVARSVVRAVLAMLAGTLLLSWWPDLVTALPVWLGQWPRS